MTDSVRTCDIDSIADGGDERRQHASADVAPELYGALGRDRTDETTPAGEHAATEGR
jgi:hypothetical protein